MSIEDKIQNAIPVTEQEFSDYAELVKQRNNRETRYSISFHAIKPEYTVTHVSRNSFIIPLEIENKSKKKVTAELKVVPTKVAVSTIDKNSVEISKGEKKQLHIQGYKYRDLTMQVIKVPIKGSTKVFEFEILLYFPFNSKDETMLKNPYVVEGEGLHMFRKIRDITPSSILGTFYASKLRSLATSKLVLRLTKSPMLFKRDWPLAIKGYAEFAFVDPTVTKHLKGCPDGYFIEYVEGQNLFEIVDSLSLSDKHLIANQIIPLFMKYEFKSYNTHVCPQNVIITIRKAAILSPRCKGDEHSFSRTNLAFSCPADIKDVRRGAKYNLGNILYFLFSGYVPYSFGKHAACSTKEIIGMKEKSIYCEFPPDFPADMKKLIIELWDKRKEPSDLQKRADKAKARPNSQSISHSIQQKVRKTREETELLLNKAGKIGGFFVRWSDNANSFVISIKTSTGFIHLPFREQKGFITFHSNQGSETMTLIKFTVYLMKEYQIAYLVSEEAMLFYHVPRKT